MLALDKEANDHIEAGPGKDYCRFDVDTKGTVATADDELDTLVGCEIRWAEQTGPLSLPNIEFWDISIYHTRPFNPSPPDDR